MARLRMLAVPVIAATLLLAGCSKGNDATAGATDQVGGSAATGSATPGAGATSWSDGAEPSGMGSGSGCDESGSGCYGPIPEGGESSQNTDDDRRVFGFATTDEAELAAASSEVSAQVNALASAAATGNLDAVEANAQGLLATAERMQRDADHAYARQKPLQPADPGLIKARGNALSAFKLTADYAQAAVNLADALKKASLSELAAAVNEVVNLSGTSTQVESSYAELNAELTAWARSNPYAAASALKSYG